MISIAKPINNPPMRLALKVPSGNVGNTGVSMTPSPQRSQAPIAAPPPTARIPPQGIPNPFRTNTARQSLRKSSADKLVHVIRAKADVTVVPAAHLDLGEHVLVSNLSPGLVEVNHGAADIEEGDHFAAVFGNDESMDLARRLVDEASLFRNPIVLEIAPLALDHVPDDDHRMAVPGQHSRAPHAQQIAPAAADRVQQQWAEPDVCRLRHPDALVAGNRRHRDLGDEPQARQNRGSGHLRLLQRGGELRDLTIDVAILWKWPTRAPVPIARVAEVSFHNVHDAVCPTSKPGFVLLHDSVRFFPLSFFEMTYRGSKCHGFPLCNQITSIDRQDNAGNKRRGGRTQKNSRGRDVVRLAPAPDRCARPDGAAFLRGVADNARERRCEPARGEPGDRGA